MSTPAYYVSDDIFAKAVYTLGQTMSVAAVGYGSYLVLVENDYLHYKGILDGVPELAPAQRDRLAYEFLKRGAERARNVRKIRMISHSLSGALNFLNAATTSHSELRTSLIFLGSINTLAVLGFAFGKSEEEKFLESLPGSASKASFHFVPTPEGAWAGTSWDW